MKKNVLICGLIGGIITSGWFLLSETVFDSNMSLNARMFFGYASMVLAFSLIFVGVKNYRDNYAGGIISFWKALKVALLITLVASTIYVLAWMIESRYLFSDYIEKYTKVVIKEMRAAGASAATISNKEKEMAAYSQMYKNPLFNALMTYFEILPVGLIMSIIAALTLKKKEATSVPGN